MAETGATPLPLPEPAPAFDTSIWRVLGNPLLAAESDGELTGETVAVKDLYAVSGFTVGAGIPEYLREGGPAPATAPAVRALLRAGASVHGIAQTDEFAYSLAGTNVHYGTPPNPRVPGGIPGGSSSGPAAAVALGHASIGLATDTAGSVRVPASYQGLWGLRTTYDAVSREGLLPLAPSFDTVGWLTRTPALLRAAAAATLDAGAQIPAPERYAVAGALVFRADAGAQDAFVAALDRLERQGLLAAPALVDLGELSEVAAAFRTVQAAEAWRAHGAWVREHPGVLGADIAARFVAASRVTAVEETRARAALAEARDRIDTALEGRILLLLSASSAAPARSASPAALDATRAATATMTCLAAVGGYPAVSAPLLEVDGSPLGLGLVGPRFSDLALLDAAARLAVAP